MPELLVILGIAGAVFLLARRISFKVRFAVAVVLFASLSVVLLTEGDWQMVLLFAIIVGGSFYHEYRKQERLRVT